VIVRAPFRRSNTLVELPFSFDVRGYEFQNVLDAIRKSAQASLAGLSREINALEQQLEEYLRVGEFEGELDEEGCVWKRDKLLEHKITSAYEGLMEPRKAFAIAIYHFLERSVQR
jgi:hypothetical protein